MKNSTLPHPSLSHRSLTLLQSPTRRANLLWQQAGLKSSGWLLLALHCSLASAIDIPLQDANPALQSGNRSTNQPATPASSGSGGPLLNTSPGTPSASNTAPAHSVRFDPALCRLQTGAPYQQTVGIRGSNLMVTSADIHASSAGCKVLARGGSAIDAAIAVQAVLAVVEPFASGLAGGSVITYYDAGNKQVHAFDGLSAAPAQIGVAGINSIYQMAVDSDLACRPGQVLGGSLSAQQANVNISGRAVGVPGTLAVLDLVHQRHGKAAWNSLWEDAITLATNGFPMTDYMYASLYNTGTVFDDETGTPLNAGGVNAWWNTARDRWGAVRCQYKDIRARYCDPSDPASTRPLPVGTLIKNSAMVVTMQQVRDGGAAAFYDPQGSIVAAILRRFAQDKFTSTGANNCTSLLPATYNVETGTTSAAITPARIPSLMSASDFASYRAIEREPLVGEYFGMRIYTQPPPSFGGVVTLHSLGLLARKDLASQPWASPGFYYLASEASRFANADRRNIVGDPQWSNVGQRVDAMLGAPYLDSRAGLINGVARNSVIMGGLAEGIPGYIPANPASQATSGSSNVASTTPIPRTGSAASQPAAGPAAPDENKVSAESQARLRRERDGNTTSSLAIIDGYGNALAMTTTINTHWGAHIEAAGMMLNNALSNFSAGAVGSDVNGYAANKRPRSSIAPAIAFDAQRRLRLVWGSAGGGPIPDYIVKTFLGNAVYGKELQGAINADNWSGQGLPASVAQFESGRPIAGLINTMRSTYGYSSSTLNDTGLVSGLAGIAVEYDANGWPIYIGAADKRRAGGASGY